MAHADALAVNLVALICGTLILASAIFVVGMLAAAGKASPRNPLLRAPGGEHRGKPLPPTWHCEHAWKITQEIAAPYFRRQSITLIAACGLVGLLDLVGVSAKFSYPVIVMLFLVTSYITFSIGGGQRNHKLSQMHCDHFDGSPLAPSAVPPRSQRYTHTQHPAKPGRALPV